MPQTPPISYGTIPVTPDNEGILTRTPRILWIRGALSELSVLAPLIIFITTVTSSIFYRYYNGWEMSTAIYFACQTVVGIMYGVPEGEDRISQSFTLFLYFLGSTYIYAAVAAYANLVAERTVKSAKDIVRMEHVEDMNSDGVIRPRHWVAYMCNHFCNALDWNNNKLKFITVGATFGWIGVGVVFGLSYEGYDLYKSVYFSLDAMMLSGTLTPPCVEVKEEGGLSGCTLGTTRAFFMSVYLLIGSPLFIFTMGQFYESLVHNAQLSHQRQKYSTDFTPEEFDYAATCFRSSNEDMARPQDSFDSSSSSVRSGRSSPRLLRSASFSHSRSVDLAEFMLLELLRTEAISRDEIQYLKAVFESNKKDRYETIEYDGIEDNVVEEHRRPPLNRSVSYWD